MNEKNFFAAFLAQLQQKGFALQGSRENLKLATMLVNGRPKGASIFISDGSPLAFRCRIFRLDSSKGIYTEDRSVLFGRELEDAIAPLEKKGIFPVVSAPDREGMLHFSLCYRVVLTPEDIADGPEVLAGDFLEFHSIMNRSAPVVIAAAQKQFGNGFVWAYDD